MPSIINNEAEPLNPKLYRCSHAQAQKEAQPHTENSFIISDKVRKDSVYLEYSYHESILEQFRARGLEKSIRRDELERLHKSFDVVFLDFYGVLVHPPDGFVALMNDLNLGPVDCVDDGFLVVYQKQMN